MTLKDLEEGCCKVFRNDVRDVHGGGKKGIWNCNNWQKIDSNMQPRDELETKNIWLLLEKGINKYT